MQHSTTDPRVRQIGATTWIDGLDKYVFEATTEGAQGETNLGVNVYNLRKGPGQWPPVNEVPYDTLDAAIVATLGERPE